MGDWDERVGRKLVVEGLDLERTIYPELMVLDVRRKLSGRLLKKPADTPVCQACSGKGTYDLNKETWTCEPCEGTGIRRGRPGGPPARPQPTKS